MLIDRKIRVGAAQTFPEWFDLPGTIQKAEHWMEAGRREGLDLLVFPETFLSGYPYWRGSESMRDSIDYLAHMQEGAIEVPSAEVDRLCLAAKRFDINCVIGVNELDRQGGAFTLYNSQLIISRGGSLVASRRKLMPTHSERVYWGRGGREDIFACDLDIGRVGALICYEHHLGLLSAAMGLLGEEVHCAVWPGWWELTSHLGDKRPSSGARSCDIEPITRAYAIQNGTFVVNCCPYAPEAARTGPWARAYLNQVAIGGSNIINPSGVYVVPPTFDAEGLVWSEIDLKERRLAKSFFDACGHYSRYDVLRLQGHEELVRRIIREPSPAEDAPRTLPVAQAT